MARGTSTHPCRPSAKGARPWSPVAASRVGRAVLWLPLVLLVGCSGRGTYITGGPSTSQLKTSLSQLEFQNEQLRTQVARLKEENRDIEDKLVQERIHSDELITKLDNARNRLRDDGYDVDADLDAPLARPRTLPAGRSTPPKRKAPAAQISRASETDEIPPIRIDDGASSSRRPPTRSSRGRATRGDDMDDVSLNEKDFHWIPIAQGDDADANAPKR